MIVGLAGPLVLDTLRSLPHGFTAARPPHALRPAAQLRSAAVLRAEAEAAVAVEAAEAPAAEAEAEAEAEPACDKRLLGAWRYPQGGYSIRSQGSRIYFIEHGMIGELKEADGWFLAELPPAGIIRLKLADSGKHVESNFKAANDDKWGDTITAVREWETLGAKAAALKEELATLKFTGNSTGVILSVDGRQRPVALEISPEAAAAGDLGSRIMEAQRAATADSLAGMTEKLRELYAQHFGSMPVDAQTEADANAVE